jgi:hypothetical protein
MRGQHQNRMAEPGPSLPGSGLKMTGKTGLGNTFFWSLCNYSTSGTKIGNSSLGMIITGFHTYFVPFLSIIKKIFNWFSQIAQIYTDISSN